MGAPRKVNPYALFSPAGEPDEAAGPFRFSREDVTRLCLSEPLDRRRALQKGRIIFMESARNAWLDPALIFLQRLITAQIPGDLNIESVRDKNACMNTIVLKNRGSSGKAVLEVDSECLFRNAQTGSEYSAGEVKIIFNMHDKKVHGKWGYEFNCVKTDSPVVAAFFSNDQARVAEALQIIEEHLSLAVGLHRRPG